jgi:hypothetical protein
MWSGLLVSVRHFFSSFVGPNVPVLVELPLSASGSRKFQIDTLGDHLYTCTTHSGVKKDHDWVVDSIADLFFAQPTK